MIRTARPSDIPALVEMGRRFHAAAGLGAVAAYVDSDTRDYLKSILETGVLLIAEQDGAAIGAIGGVAVPLYFNRAHITGNELFFWVEPEHRGIGVRLMKELETRVRRVCNSWAMCSMEGENVDGVDRLYQRLGFAPRERTYLKVF